MTWIRIDDRMPEHPKVAGLSDRAFRVYVEVLCYCGGNLTDGIVPAAVVKARGWGRAIPALIAAGLMRRSPAGWYQVHDYLEYQPSRAEAVRKAEQRRKAAVRGGLARVSSAARAAGRFTVIDSDAPAIPSDSPADSADTPTSPPPIHLPDRI